MFEAERKALKETFKLPRPTVRETLLVSALYAAQAVVCVLLLKQMYVWRHWNAVTWAMIAAILALQPGLHQSVVTSIIRILANTVGAVVALIVSRIAVHPELQLVVALVIVVLVCELMRLDFALRTACVAVVIVLTANGGHVQTSGMERFSATIIGCLMALMVQLVTDLLWKKLIGKSDLIEPVKS